jgi:ABC-type nickel/cobalt efflux system permease component RcnA
VRAALLGGALALVVLPALAAAHPLGNFTINHYAGLRVEPERILLDVVIDQAEIPAFQARQDLDLDGDGELSDDELEAARITACDDLAGSLALDVGGVSSTLTVIGRGLDFPPGVGGLSTMRLVCAYEAGLPSPIAAGTRLSFTDDSFADRLGWREIVVEGSGVTLEAVDGEVRSTSISARLTEYPEALLERPIADRSVVVMVSPGGPTLPGFAIADAVPLAGAWPDAAAAPGGPGNAPAAVPGGIGGEIPALFSTADLTPFILILSFLVAAALGAGHALTPGHGKTLMAAYLVGTRGTPVHALGLGLSVSVSHTLGILVLALIVVGAQGVLAPDLVVRIAPIVAAVSIVAIGAWMLAGEIRRRARAREAARAHAHAHELGHDHEHSHGHEHGDEHGDEHSEHSHGGVSHSHAPVPGSTITWRSLFALGLAGGLIPSTNALLILLGAVAAGRPAFGILLVAAFGLGMAAVMAGIGLVLVIARGRIDLLPAGSSVSRIREWVPAGAAVVVLGLGIWLTTQAVLAPPTL